VELSFPPLMWDKGKAIGDEGGGHFVSHIDRRRERQRQSMEKMAIS